VNRCGKFSAKPKTFGFDLAFDLHAGSLVRLCKRGLRVGARNDRVLPLTLPLTLPLLFPPGPHEPLPGTSGENLAANRLSYATSGERKIFPLVPIGMSIT